MNATKAKATTKFASALEPGDVIVMHRFIIGGRKEPMTVLSTTRHFLQTIILFSHPDGRTSRRTYKQRKTFKVTS